MSAIRIVKLAGAVVLAGVAGTIYYILRKKLDTGWGSEEVAVPADVVGRFIGRKGANVKLIEAKTQTKIHFKDTAKNDGSHRVCVIRGPLDRLWLARSLVEQSMQKLCAGNTVQHFDVPAEIIGGIIGSRGHRINEIMHTTSTRISVERKGNAETQTTRRVEVHGSPEGVEEAVRLLQDRVQSLQRAEARRNVNLTAPSRTFCSPTGHDLAQHASMLHPENSASDVYVCSVSSATSLYVQLVSPKLDELNTMVEEMTSYYSEAANKLPVSSKRLGIVAAPYPFDNRWYRAWQVGHAGKTDATRLKKRSNPSGAVSAAQNGTDNNSLLKNNNKEGTHNACHSPYSTNEINISSLGSGTVSSVQGNGHLRNVERDTSTQCDNILKQCDGSLKPESKLVSGNVDRKTSSSDAFRTKSAKSNSDNGCDTSSLDNQHSQKCSLIAVHPEEDLTAVRALAKEHTALFFVDYGDYALVPAADFCDLRTDFLSLSHQAFLVHLAGVVPVAGQSLQAQYHLSNLTRCGEWQPISAKIVGYQHNSLKFEVDSNPVGITDPLKPDDLSYRAIYTSENSMKTKLNVLYSMLRKIVSDDDDADEKEDLDYDSFQNYDVIEKRLFDSLQMLSNLTSQLRLRESLLTLSQMNQNQNKTDAEQEEFSKLVSLSNELQLYLHPNGDRDSSSGQDDSARGKLTQKEVQNSPAVIAELINKIGIVKKKHHLYQLVQRVLCCGGDDLQRVGAGPVPLVKLFVSEDGQEIDVADDMVSKGLLQLSDGLAHC